MLKPILLKNILAEMLGDDKMWHRIMKEATPIKNPHSATIPLGGKEIVQRAGTLAPKRPGGIPEKQTGITGYRDNSGNIVYSHNSPNSPNSLKSIDETTDLRSLVAKVANEAHANEIVKVLQSYQIDARAADGAVFNPSSQTEDEGWGVYVTAGNVINAGKVLGKHQIAQGASFDPYVKSGK